MMTSLRQVTIHFSFIGIQSLLLLLLIIVCNYYQMMDTITNVEAFAMIQPKYQRNSSHAQLLLLIGHRIGKPCTQQHFRRNPTVMRNLGRCAVVSDTIVSDAFATIYTGISSSSTAISGAPIQAVQTQEFYNLPIVQLSHTANTAYHTTATMIHATPIDSNAAAAASTAALSPTTNIIVFVVGLIPFGIATIEFWRRIAVGASFGTTKNAVVFSIGEDNNPVSSRGKQILGKDALITAYVIFAIAISVLVLVVYSVSTTPLLPPPPPLSPVV